LSRQHGEAAGDVALRVRINVRVAGGGRARTEAGTLGEVVALLTLRRLVASWNADCFWHHPASGPWLQLAVHPWNVDAVGSGRLLVAHHLVDSEALLDRDPLALSITCGEVVAVGGLFCSGLTPWQLDTDHLRPVTSLDPIFGDGDVETLVLSHFSAILSGSLNLLGLSLRVVLCPLECEVVASLLPPPRGPRHRLSLDNLLRNTLTHFAHNLSAALLLSTT